ncbi:basal-body rod modification protein FlgD [Roseovarius sp. A-2]|uniref:flagellar hook capping FlgD N-terminal domain-containing protein n=1 Tax=Roseovarius sp. A-2 TaxID=1570360 RepID=UPI0009B54746|nr:flagellar hook capping FlgD N-terminal domain-containing protein [Roseovarius sp. A-2]GAW34497.1 basal-body rod modification protein FlgD [Roseovarius sp. A-2]
MDITDLTQATGQTTATRATTAEATQSGGAISADFETFLKMLTTQMRNQDPLNPVDSSDFAVQLATFSTVEQQVRTNDLLTGLGAQMGALGLGQLSGWIGLEAEAKLPVAFDGTPVQLTATVDPLADAAELVVTDPQGLIVQRQAIAPQSGRITWDGRDVAGIPLAPGTYDISVQSQRQGEIIARHDVHVNTRISEARQEGNETRLVLDTGQTVAASDVLGLRTPEAAP